MNISPRIPRVALVTGAARRIGAAIALALAGAGFDIAVHFRTSRNEAESLAPSIRRLGRRAELFQRDLALESQIETLIEGVQAVLGPVGLLINNASLFQRDEWDTATRRSWDAHLESNLRAPFVLTQHFARSLPAEAEGLVINMLDQRVLVTDAPLHFLQCVEVRAVGSHSVVGAGACAPYPCEWHWPWPRSAQRATEHRTVRSAICVDPTSTRYVPAGDRRGRAGNPEAACNDRPDDRAGWRPASAVEIRQVAAEGGGIGEKPVCVSKTLRLRRQRGLSRQMWDNEQWIYPRSREA